MTEQETIRQLAYRVRRAVLSGYRADTCILTAAALCDALAERGIPARPIVCRVMLVNDHFLLMMRVAGRLPNRGRELQAWCAMGGWSVGVGYGPPADETRWAGHLAVLVRGSLLVDCSLDQADRISKGIQAGIVLQPVPADQIVEEGKVVAHLTAGAAIYSLYPDERSYEVAPDWREMNRRTAVVAAAERLRGRMFAWRP